MQLVLTANPNHKLATGTGTRTILSSVRISRFCGSSFAAARQSALAIVGKGGDGEGNGEDEGGREGA